MRIALTIGLLLGLFPVLPVLAYPAHSRVVAKKKGAASYAYTSTGFSTAHLTYTGNLTGVTDNKTVLVSFWLKLTAGNGALRQVFSAYDGGSNRRVEVLITTGDLMRVVLRNSASTVIYTTTQATGTFTTATGWAHVACSCNLATAATHLFINGVSNESNGVNNDDTIDYNMAGGSPAWHFCGIEDNTQRITGLVSEVYLTNEYLNLTTNITKFRTTGGKPENLGATGSTPTGTQPLIYLKNAFGTFQTNLGSGGNFAVTGSALTDGGADKP